MGPNPSCKGIRQPSARVLLSAAGRSMVYLEKRHAAGNTWTWIERFPLLDTSQPSWAIEDMVLGCLIVSQPRALDSRSWSEADLPAR